MLLSLQKLREAGIDIPEVGKKAGVSHEEENKLLKTEVKNLKDELDATRKGNLALCEPFEAFNQVL